MKNHVQLLAVGCALLSLSVATSQAATTLNTTDSGWYDGTGFHGPGNENYFTGLNGGDELRSFFTFDLSMIAPTVTSATLRLYNQGGSFAGYLSPDATETFSLFDVTTSIASLTAGGGGLVGTFADLGTGVSYGTKVVSAADNGTVIEIALNAAAIAAINASAGSSFALGGALTTIGGVSGTEAVFRFSHEAPFVRELVLTQGSTSNTVPDAGSSALLVLLGFLPLAAFARRQQQMARA